MEREKINKLKNLVENNQFVVIYDFMVSDLKLSGTELDVFARIYSFTVSKSGVFNGSVEYLASKSGVSRYTIMRALKKLVSMNYILREENRYISYSVNLDMIINILSKSASGTAVANCNIQTGDKLVANCSHAVANCNAIQKREDSIKKEFGIHPVKIDKDRPRLEDVVKYFAEEKIDGNAEFLWNKFNELNWNWKGKKIFSWKGFLKKWVSRASCFSLEEKSVNPVTSFCEDKKKRQMPFNCCGGKVLSVEELKHFGSLFNEDPFEDSNRDISKDSSRCA